MHHMHYGIAVEEEELSENLPYPTEVVDGLH